tara:strand:- start:342 stop:719 length:378 start_codon:yes stop_codon:yes gene_type:complete
MKRRRESQIAQWDQRVDKIKRYERKIAFVEEEILRLKQMQNDVDVISEDIFYLKRKLEYYTNLPNKDRAFWKGLIHQTRIQIRDFLKSQNHMLNLMESVPNLETREYERDEYIRKRDFMLTYYGF